MTSIIDSTRKNHALEHATMRVLAEHYKLSLIHISEPTRPY